MDEPLPATAAADPRAAVAPHKLNRRTFLEAGGAAMATGLAGNGFAQDRVAATPTSSPLPNQDDLAGPTESQREWMSLAFGMFIHFGINTYYDTEWSDGTLNPAAFHPTDLDTEQWAVAARAAGMKYLVLVAKHHDGFCNWPTKTTDYCVRSTPFKGDIIAEVVEAAHKHDLKVGLYYSLWDCHEPSYDDDWRYTQFVKAQLQELLTQYGPIVELWFDGMWKKQKSGWEKQLDTTANSAANKGRDERFVGAWRAEGAYRWQMDHLYQYVKQLQPECLLANNATTAYAGVPLHPVDLRSGERATALFDDRKVWPWLGRQRYFPLQIETTLSQFGKDRFPNGSWFWHEWDHSVASRETVLQWLEVAGTMQANLLLNVGPSPEGKLRPEDERVLHSLQ